MFLLHKKRSALLILVYVFYRQIVDSRPGEVQNTALKYVRVILTLMLEAWNYFVFRKKREALTCSAQRLTQFDESVHVFVSRRVRTFLYNSFSNQLLSLAAGRRVLPSRWVSEAQTFHTFSFLSRKKTIRKLQKWPEGVLASPSDPLGPFWMCWHLLDPWWRFGQL